ncbi:MAG: hypothetical protein AAGD38_19560 [Acidobacteriota bacterium]
MASGPEPATIRVSVPGKTILCGEHAAVYGHPALVAAIDRRLEARLTPVSGRTGDVQIAVPQLDCHETVSWSKIHAHTDRTRSRWLAYREDGDARHLVAADGDPAHLVKVALGEAAAVCGGEPPFVFDLHVASALPIGAGFGSSAAAAVAIAAALLVAMGHEPTVDALMPIALDIERRQHGQPSGVDPATVLRGGVVWATREEGELKVEPIDLRAPLAGLTLIHTGTPAETTGEVVAAVRRRLERDPGLETELERLGTITHDFRALLEAPDLDPDALLTKMRNAQTALERLGVVPPAVQALARAVEAAGGAAKISGAGALSDPAAGAVIVYHPERHALDGLPELATHRRLDTHFGAEGLRILPMA